MTTHRGVETALRESEHRFRQLTESLPQLVWTCTPEGNCDYLSPQWVDFTGMAEAEQLGSGWLQQVHPDDREGVVSAWGISVESGAPFHVEYRIRRSDGSFCWFDSRGIPLRNAQDRIVKWFGTCTDIHDRKSIEADQRFKLRLSAALQSISPVRQIAEDATRLLAEYVQAASCALHEFGSGRSEARLLHRYLRPGMSPAAFIDNPKASWVSQGLVSQVMAGDACGIDNTAFHPFTAASYQAVFQPARIEALILVPLRRKGQTACLLSLGFSEPHHWTRREIDLAQAAGERIWLGYEAAQAQSAQTAMHETLAASERRLQAALQSASIGIWENDPVTNINTWDARSRLIFGFPPDLKVDAEVVMSCIHPDDREATQKSIEVFMDPEGSGHFAIDYRVVMWNGQGIRHVFAQGQMFYEGEGANRHPIRSIGTVQDVTELKKGEEALRRANLELEQFAYAAAHDLQEPLRNVGLATQILASRYKGTFDPDAENLLQTSVEGALRMQAMVKDLLAYSRAVMLEEGAVLFADPNVVLALALKNLVVAIEEKQAQISWEKLPNLRMSETHLLQLLQNLISNSLKYSGSVSPKIHVAATTKAGECVFLVQDNGLGIPPEYHQRAFGVFKRLHSREVPGTGIGLALCKRIVEHYGGRIWIESRVGEGTTVLFTVPVV